VAQSLAIHPPPPDEWMVAIHRSATDRTPIGAGFVIDRNRVLTSGHVVGSNGAWHDELWVSFPMAPGLAPDHRCRVLRCLPDQPPSVPDVAVLELADPGMPAQVPRARLRDALAADLFDHRWWAFGFPDGSLLGDDARGWVATTLAYGGIKLRKQGPVGVRPGFSGSALWSYDYDAVVGVIVSADARSGDGHAVTLQYIDEHLPELKILAGGTWSVEAADDAALAAWGWSLQSDPERGRHWSPRARGVAVETERGYRFRGRDQALGFIRKWLDRARPDQRVLVVTGSPGVGKSAVLGRIVTTADADIRDVLPHDDIAVRATPGSVAAAVHVKGKTALEVATEIARAASVALPAVTEDLVPALRARLESRDIRFNLVVDALDEAAGPAEARAIVRTLLIPLAQTCADVGAQVVVGTRRADYEGDLLGLFAGASTVVDLDDAAYFEQSDLAAYALSTLQLVGAERPGNPYQDPVVARPVAARISLLAGQNFLVAGLVARTHGMFDSYPVDPAQLDFPPTVDATLDAYVNGLPAVGGAMARLALTVLAFAEASGLPLSLWRDGIAALGGDTTVDELAVFASRSAANFLIETGTEPSVKSYRLFHQALNDALLRARSQVAERAADEGRLVDAWIRTGRELGWDRAPEYLWRWLSTHARRTGRVDELLADDGFLRYADLRRLMAAADAVTTEAGRIRAQLLRRTPQAVDATPLERSALFSVTETLDRLGSGCVTPPFAPYRGAWANTPSRLELVVLEGHADAVLGVCAVAFPNRTVLASAGEDTKVRLWDPVTGQTESILDGHTDRVRDVCALSVSGQTLLVSSSDDGTIGVWDAATGTLLRRLHGHADWVRGVCALVVDGRPLIASASDDRTVRLWDPMTGSLEQIFTGRSWATELCAVPGEDGVMLASAGYDGRVTLWDPRTRELVRELEGHTAWVTALTSILVDGRTLVASTGYDGTVRTWHPGTGQLHRKWIVSDRPIKGLWAVWVNGRQLLASAGEDGAVRLHDPTVMPADSAVKSASSGGGEQALTGHTGWATDICAISAGGHELLASGGEDGTVRLWDPATGQAARVLDDGRIGRIDSLASVTVEGHEQLVSTSDDGTIRLWDPVTGAPGRILPPHHRDPVTDVCAVTVDGRQLLASAGQDGRVLLWDPAAGVLERQLHGLGDWAGGVCAVPTAGSDLLASVGDDQTVRLWNPATGSLERELHGHTEWVRGVCAVPTVDGALVASASHDGTVRLWDPVTGDCRRILSGHHGAVTAVCAVPAGTGVLLASAGADHTVRLWDPDTGRPMGVLDGHTADVTSICPVPSGPGHHLLASTSLDRTVRLWDPRTAARRRTIPVYHRALSARFVAGHLVLGLEKGLLALSLRADEDPQAGGAR
jgi:WD40 repeat protein